MGSCGIADLRRFADLGSRLFLLFAFVCGGEGAAVVDLGGLGLRV